MRSLAKKAHKCGPAASTSGERESSIIILAVLCCCSSPSGACDNGALAALSLQGGSAKVDAMLLIGTYRTVGYHSCSSRSSFPLDGARDGGMVVALVFGRQSRAFQRVEVHTGSPSARCTRCICGRSRACRRCNLIMRYGKSR